VAHLGPEARALRTDVTAWALAQAVEFDYDALTVVLAVKETMPLPLRTWREEDVWQLWWLDLVRWCLVHGVPIPPAMDSSLFVLLEHLDATTGLGPGSHELEDLQDALYDAGAYVAASKGRHPASS
jgi:hypothetical protein